MLLLLLKTKTCFNSFPIFNSMHILYVFFRLVPSNETVATNTIFAWAAYLSRHFNVVLVDWKKLTYYPCYFSALGNTKLVAQCTAQVSFRFKISVFSENVQCYNLNEECGECWGKKNQEQNILKNAKFSAFFFKFFIRNMWIIQVT